MKIRIEIESKIVEHFHGIEMAQKTIISEEEGQPEAERMAPPKSG